MGAWHLVWLLMGLVDCVYSFLNPLYYDVILGISGLTLTLTAAYDFKENKLAKNTASGALDDKATISYAEMIEHSFYQFLNLCQIIYIHFLPAHSLSLRFAFFLLITSPWLFRSRFPVNHFSANYTKVSLLFLWLSAKTGSTNTVQTGHLLVPDFICCCHFAIGILLSLPNSSGSIPIVSVA